MLEEIEFHRLAKLRLEVDEPENMYVVSLQSGIFFDFCFSDSYGRLFAYDKSFDRITTKTEKPLQQSDRIKYNTMANHLLSERSPGYPMSYFQQGTAIADT